MKIAVIGRGKTGEQILNIIAKNELIGPFHSQKKPEDHKEELKQAQVAIVFLPGEVNLQLIPLLMDLNLPTVWGSTGFDWPHNINQTLQNKKLSWVYASNFSFGMFVIKKWLEELHKWQHLFPEKSYSMEETHHIHKKDKPSGTALSWQKWGQLKDINIVSHREGDIIGDHQLTMKTSTESLSIHHKAHDRKLFAEGAIWSARQLIEQKNLPYGFHSFSELIHLNKDQL